MKVRLFLGLVVILFYTGVANAQEEDHKIEITADYSYLRFNPGLPSLFNSQNLNGGGGQGTFFFKSWVGLVADLQGYGSYTQCAKTNNSLGITGCASANAFTYLFGPQFKYRVGKVEPFFEVLPGGAHSNFYGNACRNITGACASVSPSNNAFALAIGGGVDFRASERISVRIVDADYELTRFGNNFTGGNNSQSNFRFQTGIQFRF